jgi:triosephosphate isomerase
MRKKLVAGNWKMNGSLQENEKLLLALKGALSASVEGAVLSPAPYLGQVQRLLAGTQWRWGGQDVSVHASGAYTGEVSVSMLKEFGSSYVAVGHSERRAYHAEASDAVALKTVAAIQGGLTPIVCIGETLAEREANQTFDVLASQLAPVFERTAKLVQGDCWPLVLAYEPVWAIGTGKTASPEQAQEVHAFIRQRIADALGQAVAQSTQILYGGSVKASNSVGLFSQQDIDGALVGGASLQADEFTGIIRAALG